MSHLFQKSFFVFSFVSLMALYAEGKATALEPSTSLHRQATEAVLWGMPIVAMDAMRQAYFRDAKAQYNDVVLLSKGWKNQVTTPNSSSNYLYFNFNTSKGPVVVEIPAATGGGIFGALNDAWQVPLVDFGPQGEDQGRGAKYLILPPRYKGKIPAGYIEVKSQTYNGYSVVRAIPVSNSETDQKKVWDLAYRVKVYPLAQAANPPKTRFIDMRETAFNGIASMDEDFYISLARMVNEEPVLDQDKSMMLKLKSIGIQKGKPFTFGKNQKSLGVAAHEVQEYFKNQIVNSFEPWSSGSQWGMNLAGIQGVKTGFTFKSSEGIDIKSRGTVFFMACAPAKKMGTATMYLSSTKDAQGHAFLGEESYRLHVPSKVPAEQFWAVNVYDLDTAGFIRESPVVGIDSYNSKMVKNEDGSVDIYFGPKTPPGRQDNWIYTKPGKSWFAFFRFYGPQKPILEKTWILPNIEKIPPDMKQAAQ